jgi:hypothetical protein
LDSPVPNVTGVFPRIFTELPSSIRYIRDLTVRRASVMYFARKLFSVNMNVIGRNKYSHTSSKISNLFKLIDLTGIFHKPNLKGCKTNMFAL